MALLILPDLFVSKATLPPKDFTDAVKSLYQDGYIQTKAFSWKDYASTWNDFYKGVSDYRSELIAGGVFRKPIIAGTNVVDYTQSSDKINTQTALGFWPPQPVAVANEIKKNMPILLITGLAVAFFAFGGKKWLK